MLEIKNISKQYKKKLVLDDINFQVPQGHIAVLLGGSGVGKSTMIRILAGLERADEGKISFQGTNLHHLDVGMVFQDFNLFSHLTIEQNITLPLEIVHNIAPDKAKQIAHELLEHYELADKKDVYPYNLSGGQKQRVALARTLAPHPKILCLDEPTSALDPLLTNFVARNILQLAQQNLSIIIATHDKDLIKNLPCTIYLMKHGKIIEFGESEKIFSNQNSYPLIKRFIQGSKAE
jgi:polar amino acid transport system ATP-binding protein